MFSFIKQPQRYKRLIFLSVKIPDSVFNYMFWVPCVCVFTSNSFYFFIKVRRYSLSSVQFTCNCISFVLKGNFQRPMHWKLFCFVINLRVNSLIGANKSRNLFRLVSNVSLMFSLYEFKPKKSLSISYFFLRT